MAGPEIFPCTSATRNPDGGIVTFLKRYSLLPIKSRTSLLPLISVYFLVFHDTYHLVNSHWFRFCLFTIYFGETSYQGLLMEKERHNQGWILNASEQTSVRETSVRWKSRVLFLCLWFLMFAIPGLHPNGDIKWGIWYKSLELKQKSGMERDMHLGIISI